MRYLILSIVLLLSLSCTQKQNKILVFSKTMGFRHGSIESGIKAIEKLGQTNGFEVVTTEDSERINEEELKQYAAIIFLNTTGDILNAQQQADFERFIQAGGGFVGVHAATDTEYDWPWYTKMVGAQFKNHPKVQEAKMNVLNTDHPASSFLSKIWTKTDEWYNFKSFNEDVTVILELDQDSYEGGNHEGQHPIAWYHEYDGGRAFYTGMGHTNVTFEDETFLKHLLGGIQYAIGDNQRNYAKAYSLRVPDESRFQKEVLDFNLNEPMELDELPGRGLIFVERRGAINIYDFEKQETKKVADLDVFYKNEDGLLGIAVDPNYEENNWIYLFYSAPGEAPNQHISRFDLVGDSLLKDSEKVMITVPTIRKCCHSGGGLEFGPDGNLFIGLGDNTNPFESSGYAPIDERPGRALWDAQKSAANTNDLRGKILRIKPEADGTYSIPEGNLFPEGTPGTRPEIYVMGCRNPFRFSIDSKTGFVYWGDVGPDAGKGDPLRGPHGMGEFDQARKAGFWGWPYTRGNNQVYFDYNFASATSLAPFDPQNLKNNSPNNTGQEVLPPAQSSLIWYSYSASEEFPWLGKGGVNPMGGPVFHKSDYPNAEETFPEYFENKLIIYEWMRDWIYTVELDENYDYVQATPFMTNTEFSHPMDMLFGKDGNLYVLEYGQKWNVQNLDARLSRITYNAGNRTPIPAIAADKVVGAAPLTVNFSAADCVDYDKDKLEYAWSFDEAEVQAETQEATHTFTEPGVYQVELRISDASGATARASQKILVGNTPPELEIVLDSPDTLYSDSRKVAYKVVLKDNEDGTIEAGGIDPAGVKVTFGYLPEGEDLALVTIGHQQTTIPKGRQIIDGSDCAACHAVSEKVNGPSYLDIAKKYGKEDKDYLVTTVIKGGSGVWGETLMSAHPQLSVEEVGEAVEYILSLDVEERAGVENLGVNGVLEFKEHLGKDNLGKYVLMASYLDQGHPEIPGANLSAQEQVIFTPPKIEAEDTELSAGLSTWDKGKARLLGSVVDGTHLKLADIYLDDLKSVRLTANFNPAYDYGGTVEIRKGALDGTVLGSQKVQYFHDKNDAIKYIDIPLKAANGKDALFVCFVNKQSPAQVLMNLDWLFLDYGKVLY